MEQVTRKGTGLVRKQIQIFNNTEFVEVRVLNVKRKTLFVGKDIAENLGYKKARN